MKEAPMRRTGTLAAIALIAALAGCTTGGGTNTVGFNVEPIPGSITYGGQPSTRLQRAPVGSTFTHRFTDDTLREYIETYRIAPDRSLELIRRERIRDFRLSEL
jgi:hypothetical protein